MSYTIKSGDTLGEIAVRYDVSVTEILAANPSIENANNIRVGQTISLPSTSTSTTTISSTSAQSYTVKSGDYLGGIAKKHTLSIKQLLVANPSIKDASRIRVGQVLQIPKAYSSFKNLSNQVVDFLTLKWVYSKPPANVKITAIESEEDAEIDVINQQEVVALFDRTDFFDAYRREFGLLKQKQVDGIDFILSSFESDTNIENIPSMAYMLATIKHETAETFEPITEYGGKSYFNRYDPVLADSSRRRESAKRNGNTVTGDGYKYRGRGYVQITWKNNYKRLGEALGYDLVKNPEKTLEPAIAYQILSYGMRKGAFTGKKLSDYISENNTDYINARRIINGTDKASVIKTYAQGFERLLIKARL